ncbi:dihydrofolate reductase [Pseudooceanicola aestuarii]|uniref:dihydrofolate reductase n=1 Tax=Pseudooceanicola aestuarii TaxID=2697319 RepID=UPI0013D18870|nr:dihydrofolate reductase [Pseudooceanicola aestuarii]
MLALVAARSRNGAIGKEGTIPWHAPEDLRAFSRETLGGAIIMGRRTWNSLPATPLKNRLNIVISSDPDCAPLVFANLDAAMEHARDQGYFRLYGIGGAGIYQALLPQADRLLVTDVDVDVPDADTFFPEIGPEWVVAHSRVIQTEAPRCTLREWVRKD